MEPGTTLDILPFRHLSAHPDHQEAIQTWWNSLNQEEQAHIQASFDTRMDSCEYSRTSGNGAREWHQLPIQVIGQFEEPNDNSIPDWDRDYYEYLVNHEIHVPESRQSHIGCSRHPDAAATLKAGRIPADFKCPFEEDSCPMRNLLTGSRGRDLRLILVRPAARA